MILSNAFFVRAIVAAPNTTPRVRDNQGRQLISTRNIDVQLYNDAVTRSCLRSVLTHGDNQVAQKIPRSQKHKVFEFELPWHVS
jgi:hypothetical protein